MEYNVNVSLQQDDFNFVDVVTFSPLIKDITPSLSFPGTTTENKTDEAGGSGVSLGLILPIVLIGVFLLCVAGCLYWQSWRDKRRMRSQRNDASLTRFSRNFSNKRDQQTAFDILRSSSRSTAPLRASVHEKASVVPIQHTGPMGPMVPPLGPTGPGRFSFYWDKDNWKLVYPANSFNAPRGFPSNRQLSPINEIDSPKSTDDKESVFSPHYDMNAQPPYSPYHLTWVTPQAPPPSYNTTANNSPAQNIINRRPSDEGDAYKKYEDMKDSPYDPHHNTPTTECDADSDHGSSYPVSYDPSQAGNIHSQFTSFPSSPRHNTESTGISTTHCSTDIISVFTSYPETSYPPSARNSDCMPSTQNPSSQTSFAESDGASLPSSILQYHQSRVNPNVVMSGSYPGISPKFNYTLASSVESSETNYSDNTSMLPNVGSNNTSENPTGSLSCPASTGPSGVVSPEDYSKMIDELSSIRQVSENITDLFRSWSVTAELDYSSLSSKGTDMLTTPLQNGKFPWETLSAGKMPAMSQSDSNLPRLQLQISDHNQNVVGSAALPFPDRKVRFEVPVLVDKQYWV